MFKKVRIVLHLPMAVTFTSEVVRGFHSVAIAKGWDVLMLAPEHLAFHSEFDWKPQVCVVTPEIWGKMPRKVLHGKIVVGIGGSDLAAKGIPTVAVDDAAVGREAARHLLEKGLRSFGAYGMSGMAFSWSRIAAFRAEVEAAGGSYRAEMEHVNSRANPKSHEFPSRKNLLHWLRTLPKPAGVFVPSDLWGWEVTSACHELGLSVPDDVSVVGVDNEELLCETTVPPLSSVAIPWRTMGKQAADLVERLLLGEPKPKKPILIPPAGVVARRSTDMFAVDDPQVAEALYFIRDHAHQVIRVPDILRVVTTFRLRLERNFKKCVGRTIMEEVHRVHLERAKRLLSLTDLSIAEVAENSGYPSAIKFDVAFHKAVGRTPTEHRRLFRLSEQNL